MLNDWPAWVPEDARRYIAHTEGGQGIRDLARECGCHASTISRQVRRIEARRDDPLIDAALSRLGAEARARREAGGGAGLGDVHGRQAAFEAEAIRILRRLCETGAVLAVADGVEKAVVARDSGAGTITRTAVVEMEMAQALALNEWISCANPGRVSRYRVTAAGRAALGRMLARAENRASSAAEPGFAEAQAAIPGQPGAATAQGGRTRRSRYGLGENPLVLLARRRDRDGKPFLSEELVAAGERLREDFELAQMGARVTQDWDRFLTAGVQGGLRAGQGGGRGAEAARERVARALTELGPGLSDVALRCCCYLEGLEEAERRMGWSARSAKIVLRIALQRLKRHYDGESDTDRMIG
ncbi:DUF6456 domain-containing protein [Jhaorihella thermophila]|uniref:DUF6456 domain-containing protein n=1 Tax=Jhaorihella thermophila TaxID=488547 RepID=A0A1H5RQ42_9RHOB|nr:DUF6456 domain-containing protein [Jhaorihella thermophila]SEF40435.1 hypothetical protein SAMN05421751_10191 [Jhaorihella thermophila]